MVTSSSASLFIVLDGIDGCGKTTQARRLAQSLVTESAVEPPLHLREPGSTAVGERIREIVLDPSAPVGRGALALLFAAARRETLERLVAPALAAGRHVVMERFHASTFAYQGGASPREEVDPFDDADLLAMLHRWAGTPAPGLELILDAPPEEMFSRAQERTGGGSDRFEARGLAFQERVAQAMREYASLTPAARIVDATRNRGRGRRPRRRDRAQRVARRGSRWLS